MGGDSQKVVRMTDTPTPPTAPAAPHAKVSREDWLNSARDILVTDGVGAVKILTLAGRLGVSRSSFYWYFKDRDAVLSAMLAEWETRNTAAIVDHCRMDARSISHGLCNVFRCFVGDAAFDQRLDFAVREWARRDAALRRKIDAADRKRIAAVTDLFVRFDYTAVEADARARIVYFMQLGYHALEVRENMKTRMSRVGPYLQGFTGQPVDKKAVDEFSAWVDGL